MIALGSFGGLHDWMAVVAVCLAAALALFHPGGSKGWWFMVYFGGLFAALEAAWGHGDRALVSLVLVGWGLCGMFLDWRDAW